jgi:hypothetical protein
MQGKNSKIHQIFIFGSEDATKDIEGWLKFCISYPVYSQIWLILPGDYCHFGYK